MAETKPKDRQISLHGFLQMSNRLEHILGSLGPFETNTPSNLSLSKL
jgi:hypothetical protein